jgi:hypothetical protein
MKAILMLTILALILTACITKTIPTPTNIVPNETIILEHNTINETKDPYEFIPENINPETCEKLQGKWFYHFVAPDDPLADGICNLPTTDAGKVCQDSSECESYCQATEGTEYDVETTGTCYEYQKASCMQEVLDGVASGMWCE